MSQSHFLHHKYYMIRPWISPRLDSGDDLRHQHYWIWADIWLVAALVSISPVHVTGPETVAEHTAGALRISGSPRGSCIEQLSDMQSLAEVWKSTITGGRYRADLRSGFVLKISCVHFCNRWPVTLTTLMAFINPCGQMLEWHLKLRYGSSRPCHVEFIILSLNAA
jgi:hypothetical protein